jgi:hypothetical protein
MQTNRRTGFKIWQLYRRSCPSLNEASVDLSNELREKILQEGFFVARIHDQVFELDIPDDFQLQSY